VVLKPKGLDTSTRVMIVSDGCADEVVEETVALEVVLTEVVEARLVVGIAYTGVVED